MFAMARAFAPSRPNITLLLTIMDFAHAYKHIGVDTKSTRFAVIALTDPQGAVCMAHLNTQPFGSRRAPANWERVTQFVVFVLKRIFRIWIGVYVGDLFCLEPESATESARSSVKQLCALLGLELAPDKEVAPTLSAMLLGAQVTLSRIRPRLTTAKKIHQNHRGNQRYSKSKYIIVCPGGEAQRKAWVRPTPPLWQVRPCLT